MLSYRKDIDGLRALAVISVIFYHFGYFTNGYLGVDVFFVISGFLITRILFANQETGGQRLISFYKRRVRRIVPLVLFTTTISLVVGCIVMLPDDLNRLCQSVIATNLFSNNILELVTTKDYWNVINEFKPLMHTWSLGIEEQFYLVYPLIFIFKNTSKKRLVSIIGVLSVLSLILFYSNFSDQYKFYLLPFRFFELSLGGLVALVKNSRYESALTYNLSLILLTGLLLYPYESISGPLSVVSTTTLCGLLMLSYPTDRIRANIIIENPVVRFIGKISFSLYMWHQIVLAFTRYFLDDELTLKDHTVIFLLVLFLSIISYYIVEQPFRNKERTPIKKYFPILLLWFIVLNSISAVIYFRGGVIRPVPELDIAQNDARRNMNLLYNTQHLSRDRAFDKSEKFKVLVIGNSFARDWINVLLESRYADNLDITYSKNITSDQRFINRLKNAEYVFFTESNNLKINRTLAKYKIRDEKVWYIGTKYFGTSNGLFYNHPRNNEYCLQRTSVIPRIINKNIRDAEAWGSRYIDLIGLITNDKKEVPVFTPECKFISQDCKHFTPNGAKYFSELVENQYLSDIFE